MLAFTLFIILTVSSSVSSYCRTADGDVVDYVDSAKTWDDARAHCRDSATPDATGDLVMDTTNGARAFLDAKAFELGDQIWIGGDDRNGSWQWVNGDSIVMNPETKSRWYHGKPNDLDGNRHCMVGNYGGTQWDNQSCSNKKKFVCQYDMVASGYKWVSGRFLKYFPTKIPYHKARAACKAGKGSLVIVDTDIVFNWIKEQHDEPWVGATDEMTEGDWRWENGVAMTASHYWADGEPNDDRTGEDCAVYAPRLRGLNDLDCHTTHSYICEYYIAVCQDARPPCK